MKIISYISFVMSVIILQGCSNGHDKHADEPSEHVHDEDHANEIVFTRSQAEEAGMHTETVKTSEFQSVIKTSGEIQSLHGDEHTVVATSSGVVNYVNSSITEGARVASGSTIVSISARDIYDGDPVIKARLIYETAEKEYRRAQRLVEDKIISEKDFEQIKMKYETARTSYIGQASNITSDGIMVKSPITGYIKKRIAANGEFVNVGQPVAVVSSNRRLQLRADVPENYYRELRNICGANFRTTYDNKVYRLSDLNGKLLSYGKSSSEGASYIPVTFEFDNIGDIVPGSYAEVFLLSAVKAGVITLPKEAITEEQGLYFVYIQVHEEAFVKREVNIGRSDGMRVEVLSGLNIGEKVVTKGAYQVKMASAKAEIPGHTH